MTLARSTDLLTAARAEGRGIGAMNVIQLEHAEAIVAGAERAGRPVVLQISENTADYHGALAPIGLAALRLAERVERPCACTSTTPPSVDLVQHAVELGIPSVMFDASTLAYDENVAADPEVVRRCHERGVWVEAELGEVGGKDGVHAPGVRTDPGEAAAYVAATGVDALAVAVGSSHAMLTRDAVLDEELVAAIAASTSRAARAARVLRGPGRRPRWRGAAGMTKINIATHLNASMTRAVRQALERTPGSSTRASTSGLAARPSRTRWRGS